MTERGPRRRVPREGEREKERLESPRDGCERERDGRRVPEREGRLLTPPGPPLLALRCIAASPRSAPSARADPPSLAPSTASNFLPPRSSFSRCRCRCLRRRCFRRCVACCCCRRRRRGYPLGWKSRFWEGMLSQPPARRAQTRVTRVLDHSRTRHEGVKARLPIRRAGSTLWDHSHFFRATCQMSAWRNVERFPRRKLFARGPLTRVYTRWWYFVNLGCRKILFLRWCSLMTRRIWLRRRAVGFWMSMSLWIMQLRYW